MSASPDQLRITEQLVRQLRRIAVIANDEGLYMPASGNTVSEVANGLADDMVAELLGGEDVS